MMWEMFGFAAAILAAGLFAGLTAGLFGVGGGMVLVPALMTIFKMMGVEAAEAVHLAVGTSLATIIPTSIASFRTHAKHQSVDTTILRQWAIPVIIGAAIGGYVANLLPARILTIFFGYFALAIAAYMAFAPAQLRARKALPQGIGQYLLSGIIACISAVVGIGGGSMAVPTMVLCNVPIHRAIGTASAVGLLISLPGTLVFLLSDTINASTLPGTVGSVNLIAFGLIALATMFAAPRGARLAHKLSPVLLRRIFAGFLVLIATKMITTALS
jgi:uncharacterized membrane protein YfcA